MIRLIGINWGLPNEFRHQSLHPDELVTAIPAVEYPFFKPNFYNYGTLYLTLLKTGTIAGEKYGWIPSSEATKPWQTLKGVHQTGRVLNAISGAVSVSIVFLLALHLTNLLGAFLGAFVLLSAPGYVVHSRFQTVDVFGAMLASIVLLLMVKIGKKRSERNLSDAVWLGLVVGLTAGTKYAGAVFLLPALWMLFQGHRTTFIRDAAVLVFAAVGGFFVATPGALLEPSAFSRDFIFEMNHSATGHGLVFISTPPAFIYHYVINLPAAIGVSATLLGSLGLIWAAIDKRGVWLLPLLFFVVYFLFISRAEVKFMRYVFPLLPAISLGVAFLIGKLHELGGKARWVSALAAMLLVFSITSPIGTAATTQSMVEPDSRDVAAQWIWKNIPKDATIGFVNDPWFYSPPLFPDTDELIPLVRLKSMRLHDARLLRYITPNGGTEEWDSRLITELNPQYIVFSSFEFFDHDRLSEPKFVKTMGMICEKYRLKAQFYGSHVQVAEKISAEVKVSREDLRLLCSQAIPEPHDMMYIRPVIWLFQRLDSK